MGLFDGTALERPVVCEECAKPLNECTCALAAPSLHRLPPEKQTARLAVEKRKKGKLVTVIRGLAADSNDLPDLLTRLKNACGAGGTIDGDLLEVQGDHLERLRRLLSDFGYRVRG